MFTYLFLYFLLFPIFKFGLILRSARYKKTSIREISVSKIVRYGFWLDFFHLSIALVCLIIYSNVTLSLHDFSFLEWPLEFAINWRNFPALAFSFFTLHIIGYFSLSYLHKDLYFFKFFSLFFILQFSISTLLLTYSAELIFFSWELLGLSSVLLIGFYETRKTVLKNAIRILCIYKISDFFLASAVIYMACTGIEVFSSEALLTSYHHTILISIIFLACLIKSGVGPWIWLPRTMEGPTPSSAVFYGALATHAPVFVFLKIYPGPEHINLFLIILATILLLLIGIAASSLSRQAADIKNGLAYSVTAQLALIYIEIILGFDTLALFHSISHGIYRTYEFLQSPSVLYKFHSIEDKIKAKSTDNPKHLATNFVSNKVADKFYQLTIRKFGFFNFSISLVDEFLSLRKVRFSWLSTLRYSQYVILSWLFLDIFMLAFFKENFILKQESLALLALFANILAFKNINSPKLFLGIIFISIFLTMDLLSYPLIDLAYFRMLAILIFLAVIFYNYKNHQTLSPVDNYTAVYRKGSLGNLLVLVLGFSIVGIPGFGAYFIWEYLVHHAGIETYHLLIESVLLLSFNTILFFYFYFINFCGQPEKI